MSLRHVCLLLLVTCGGCGKISTNLATVFGSSRAVRTIQNAKSVTAYRLAQPSYFEESLDAYKSSAGPITVPDDSAATLRQVLLDENTYGWDYAKPCEPDYGVRIQFAHGADTVDVLLCFDCEILSVYHNGKAVGGEDFDNAQHTLAAVVKSLFPKDKDIQLL